MNSTFIFNTLKSANKTRVVRFVYSEEKKTSHLDRKHVKCILTFANRKCEMKTEALFGFCWCLRLNEYLGLNFNSLQAKRRREFNLLSKQIINNNKSFFGLNKYHHGKWTFSRVGTDFKTDKLLCVCLCVGNVGFSTQKLFSTFTVMTYQHAIFHHIITANILKTWKKRRWNISDATWNGFEFTGIPTIVFQFVSFI